MGKCSICGYIGDCTTYALIRAVEKECGVSVAVTSCVYLDSARLQMREYDEIDWADDEFVEKRYGFTTSGSDPIHQTGLEEKR